jgi:hypothetical protein
VASGRLWSRRGLLLGGVGVAAAAVSLGVRVVGHDDVVAVAGEGRYPRWPIRPGDVMRHQRPDGLAIHLGVAAVHPPDEAYDYLRVAAVAIDGRRAPMRLDLAAAVTGGPSHVPVGRPAEPMGMEAAMDHAADVIEAGQSIITPGYVMIIPDGNGTDNEPAEAGFDAVSVNHPIPEMNGYALLLTWSQLAEILNIVTLPAG